MPFYISASSRRAISHDIGTLAISIRNDGFTLKNGCFKKITKPLLIFKGKTGGNKKNRGEIMACGVNCEFQAKAVMDSTLMRMYVRKYMVNQKSICSFILTMQRFF